MAVALLDDKVLLRLDLTIPKWGLWTCDAQLEDVSAVADGKRVVLDVGGVKRTGTVKRSGAPYGQPRCRVVGGAGKLDAVIAAKDYGQVTLYSVVGDILRAAGETVGDLSPLLFVIVPQWQRVQERAWQALQRAMRQVPDLDLWCERSGSISVRKTVWTRTVSAYAEYRGIMPQEKHLVLFSDSADVEPGVKVRTAQGDYDAERVQYVLDPDDDRSALRGNVWYL